MAKTLPFCDACDRPPAISTLAEATILLRELGFLRRLYFESQLRRVLGELQRLGRRVGGQTGQLGGRLALEVAQLLDFHSDRCLFALLDCRLDEPSAGADELGVGNRAE